MLGTTRQVRVFAYRAPADLRNGFDGLFSKVRGSMHMDPLSGDLFIFVSRTRKRAKVLYWDGTGLCLLCKRLEKGLFSAPWKAAGVEVISMTMSELSLLLEGSDVMAKMPLSPPAFSLKKDVSGACVQHRGDYNLGHGEPGPCDQHRGPPKLGAAARKGEPATPGRASSSSRRGAPAQR